MANYKPINSNASLSVKKVLNYLYSVKGIKTLSGSHNYIMNPEGTMISVSNNAALGNTNVAIHGTEFGWMDGQDLATYNNHLQLTTNTIIKYTKLGCISTATYHTVYPTSSRIFASTQRATTQAEFDAIVTIGSAMYKQLLSDFDLIIPYLKQLRDADVPLLWRPFHEMNGNWFWWGNKVGFTKLWDIMYDYFTNVHNLNNLIWVWSPNVPGDYTPAAINDSTKIWVGLNKCDVLAYDIYHDTNHVAGYEYAQANYDALLALAGGVNGKLIAVGEVGDSPTTTVYNAQPQYSWYMQWIGGYSGDAAKKAIYDQPRTQHRGFVIPSFNGLYTGDSIAQNPNSSTPKTIGDFPTSKGQFAVFENDLYVSTSSFEKTGWKNITKPENVILTSPIGTRFALSVDASGLITSNPITLLYDSFTRSDSATTQGTADTGQVWGTVGGGTFGISGNKGYSVDQFNGAMGLIDYGSSNPKDFVFSVKVAGKYNWADPNTSWWLTSWACPGIVFKALDKPNNLGLRIFHGDKVQLVKIDTGTETVLATASGLTFVDEREYELMVICKGKTVRAFVDKKFILEYTLSDAENTKYGNNTLVGIRHDRGTAVTGFPSTWDEFRVEKLI